jgi:transposase
MPVVHIALRLGIEVAESVGMRPYSLDLRQRVLDACQEGQSEKQVAKRFQISLSSVQRYKRAYRQHQTLQPKPFPGRTPKLQEHHKEAFLDLVASRSDWTLQSISQAWQKETGVSLSVSVLSDTCKRWHITLKKRVALPPRPTPSNAPLTGSR